MFSKLFLVLHACPEGCFSWSYIVFWLLLFLIICAIPTTIILVALFSRKSIKGKIAPPSTLLTFGAIISGIIAILGIAVLGFYGLMLGGFKDISEATGIPVAAIYVGHIANIVFYMGFVSMVLYLDYLYKRIQDIEDKVYGD